MGQDYYHKKKNLGRDSNKEPTNGGYTSEDLAQSSTLLHLSKKVEKRSQVGWKGLKEKT